MTYEQHRLFEDFCLLNVHFPDSKLLKNGLSYIFKKEDCELFKKEKYLHQEYMDTIKGVFERNDEALNEVENIYLEIHKDKLNSYDISVYDKITE